MDTEEHEHGTSAKKDHILNHKEKLSQFKYKNSTDISSDDNIVKPENKQQNWRKKAPNTWQFKDSHLTFQLKRSPKYKISEKKQ